MRYAITVFALLAFVPVPAISQTGDDLVPADHWAYSALDYLTDGGVEFGFPGYYFFCTEELTRAQFGAAISTAYAMFKPEDSPQGFAGVLMDLRVEFNDHLNFSDPEGTEEIEQQPQAQFLNNGETAEQQKLHLEREIPSDHWAYNAMGYLVSRGILPAVFEGFFDGSRTLTCYEMQQMTSILGMVIQTEGLEDVSGEGGQVFQVMFQTLRAEFSD